MCQGVHLLVIRKAYNFFLAIKTKKKTFFLMIFHCLGFLIHPSLAISKLFCWSVEVASELHP